MLAPCPRAVYSPCTSCASESTGTCQAADGTCSAVIEPDQCAVGAALCCEAPATPCLNASNSWGEPHFTTLDGVHYDYQSRGTFTFCASDAGGLERQPHTSHVTLHLHAHAHTGTHERTTHTDTCTGHVRCANQPFRPTACLKLLSTLRVRRFEAEVCHQPFAGSSAVSSNRALVVRSSRSFDTRFVVFFDDAAGHWAYLAQNSAGEGWQRIVGSSLAPPAGLLLTGDGSPAAALRVVALSPGALSLTFGDGAAMTVQMIDTCDHYLSVTLVPSAAAWNATRGLCGVWNCHASDDLPAGVNALGEASRTSAATTLFPSEVPFACLLSAHGLRCFSALHSIV